MSGDGTTDRGAKPPRTLFSLGRPGPRSGTVEADPTTTAEAGAEADVATPPAEAEVIELACGACGTTLPPHAAFCGECGTPVAQVDESFDLVEEVPMGDLEDADFAANVEEPPAAAVAGVVAAGATTVAEPPGPAPSADDGGTTETAQPAAVLYADPTHVEPLPPAPVGSFAITEPAYGTADGRDAAADTVASASVMDPAPAGVPPLDPDANLEQPTEDHGPGAAPYVAGAAVAGAAVAGAAVAGTELSAGAAEAAGATDAQVLADLAATTDVPAGTDAAAAAATAAAATSPWAPAPVGAAAPADPTVAGVPTAVEPVVPPITGPATSSAAGTPAVPVAAAAYGAAPPPSGGGKSRTGLIVGVAAAVVLVLIVGGIIIATGGSKDDEVQTAQQATTTVAPTSTTTEATSTTQAPTSEGPTTEVAPSTEPVTTDPATPDTSVASAPTTVATTQVAPTNPRPPVTQAPPTTTVEPGRIVAFPASGSRVPIPKGGSMQITLDNVGDTAASCALTGSNGVSASQNCSPSIGPRGRVVVTVTADPNKEGPAMVTGVLEGAGSYQLTIDVQNG